MAIGYKMRPSTRKCDKDKVFKKNFEKNNFCPITGVEWGTNILAIMSL